MSFIQIWETVMGSPITLFILSVLLSWNVFSFLCKLVDKVNGQPYIRMAVFSLLNGVFMTSAEMIASRNMPVLLLLAVPAVAMLELSTMTSDSTHGYGFLLSALVMNFACIYSVASAATGLWPDHLWLMGSREYRIMVTSLTCLLAILLLTHLNLSKFFPTAALRELIHSRSRGILLLAYLSICGVVLLLSAVSILPVMFIDSLPREVEVATHFDVALKSGLIQVCSYMIIVVQCRRDQAVQRSQKLDDSLQREREFRASAQKRAMLRYCANASQNRLEEGQEYFTPVLLEGGGAYLDILKRFTAACVHPEDWSELQDVSAPTYFRDKLMNDPSFFMRLRVSPEQMLAVTDPPEAVREKLQQADKEWIWVEFHCTVTRDVTTQDILVYVALVDVDAEVAQEDALRTAASTDALTGLLNRAAMQNYVREYLAKENAAGTLFIIDLDYFKVVNDTLGHPEGDRLLQETAAMLRGVFRAGDIIGRLGGDEFCVFAPGNAPRDVMEQRAREMNERSRRSYTAENDQVLRTSLSIGAAVCPGDGTEYDTLYQHADTALYQAKKAGRDRYRFYSADMAEKDGA